MGFGSIRLVHCMMKTDSLITRLLISCDSNFSSDIFNKIINNALEPEHILCFDNARYKDLSNIRQQNYTTFKETIDFKEVSGVCPRNHSTCLQNQYNTFSETGTLDNSHSCVKQKTTHFLGDDGRNELYKLFVFKGCSIKCTDFRNEKIKKKKTVAGGHYKIITPEDIVFLEQSNCGRNNIVHVAISNCSQVIFMCTKGCLTTKLCVMNNKYNTELINDIHEFPLVPPTVTFPQTQSIATFYLKNIGLISFTVTGYIILETSMSTDIKMSYRHDTPKACVNYLRVNDILVKSRNCSRKHCEMRLAFAEGCLCKNIFTSRQDNEFGNRVNKWVNVRKDAITCFIQKRNNDEIALSKTIIVIECNKRHHIYPKHATASTAVARESSIENRFETFLNTWTITNDTETEKTLGHYMCNWAMLEATCHLFHDCFKFHVVTHRRLTNKRYEMNTDNRQNVKKMQLQWNNKSDCNRKRLELNILTYKLNSAIIIENIVIIWNDNEVCTEMFICSVCFEGHAVYILLDFEMTIHMIVKSFDAKPAHAFMSKGILNSNADLYVFVIIKRAFFFEDINTTEVPFRTTQITIRSQTSSITCLGFLNECLGKETVRSMMTAYKERDYSQRKDHGNKKPNVSEEVLYIGRPDLYQSCRMILSSDLIQASEKLLIMDTGEWIDYDIAMFKRSRQLCQNNATEETDEFMILLEYFKTETIYDEILEDHVNFSTDSLFTENSENLSFSWISIKTLQQSFYKQQALYHLDNMHDLSAYTGIKWRIWNNFHSHANVYLPLFDSAPVHMVNYKGLRNLKSVFSWTPRHQIDLEVNIECINASVPNFYICIERPLQHTDRYEKLKNQQFKYLKVNKPISLTKAMQESDKNVNCKNILTETDNYCALDYWISSFDFSDSVEYIDLAEDLTNLRIETVGKTCNNDENHFISINRSKFDCLSQSSEICSSASQDLTSSSSDNLSGGFEDVSSVFDSSNDEMDSELSSPLTAISDGIFQDVHAKKITVGNTHKYTGKSQTEEPDLEKVILTNYGCELREMVENGNNTESSVKSENSENNVNLHHEYTHNHRSSVLSESQIQIQFKQSFEEFVYLCILKDEKDIPLSKKTDIITKENVGDLFIYREDCKAQSKTTSPPFKNSECLASCSWKSDGNEDQNSENYCVVNVINVQNIDRRAKNSRTFLTSLPTSERSEFNLQPSGTFQTSIQTCRIAPSPSTSETVETCLQTRETVVTSITANVTTETSLQAGRKVETSLLTSRKAEASFQISRIVETSLQNKSKLQRNETAETEFQNCGTVETKHPTNDKKFENKENNKEENIHIPSIPFGTEKPNRIIEICGSRAWLLQKYKKSVSEVLKKELKTKIHDWVTKPSVNPVTPHLDKHDISHEVCPIPDPNVVHIGHTESFGFLDVSDFISYMNTGKTNSNLNDQTRRKLKRLLITFIVKTVLSKKVKTRQSKKNRIKQQVRRQTLGHLIKQFFAQLDQEFCYKKSSQKKILDQIFDFLPIRYNNELTVFPINGLQQYFEQMSVPVSARPAHAETMKFEWVRVRSYWSFPSNIKVSPITMARVGFYYTGKCAECRCFSCGKVYKDWKDNDDPYEIHQRISPNCFYLNGRESGNVPIHEEDRFKPRQHVDQTLFAGTDTGSAARQEAEAAAVMIPGLSRGEISQISVPVGRPFGISQSGDFSFRPPTSTQPGSSLQQSAVSQPAPGYFSPLTQTVQIPGQTASTQPSLLVPGQTPAETTTPSSQLSSTLGQPSSTTSLQPSVGQSQGTSGQQQLGFQSGPPPVQFNAGSSINISSSQSQTVVQEQTPPLTTGTTSPPATSTSTTSQPATSTSTITGRGQSSSTPGPTSQPPPTSTTRTAGSSTEPSRSRFDPLGINFEKPRYPAYAVLTVRVNTYSGWPNYLDQTPRTMGMAGFFYAGYGDYTRCFFCGGGLRNWEAGDDPWVEHARWFPKCAFLRQNRGDSFVNMVQARHQEAESTNQPILLPRQLSVLDEGRPSTIMSSIPVQTLREMGKEDAIINQAIDRWRASRRQTGRTNDYTEMQATEIYEIILQIEEERHQGASAQPLSGNQLAVVQQTGTQTPDQSLSGHQKDETTVQATGGTGKSEEKNEGFAKVLEEYEEQKERLTCKICTENPVAIAFLPCGHLVCCLDCAPAMRKCPVCNELVKGTIKTFFP